MPVRFIPSSFPIVLAIMCLGCSSYSGKSFLPAIAGYDERNKQVFVLKKDLLEISGIIHLSDDTLAAINDEKGKVYVVDLKTNAMSDYSFEGKGDYEDLAKTDSAFFILESGGDLYEMNLSAGLTGKYKFPLKKIEFESLVWYRSLNKLVLITKEQRAKNAGISAYSFDLATRQFDTEPFFFLSYKEVFVKLENYNANCKPSGAAISPANKKLYIIASVGKLLLECSQQGKLEKIYKLNPAHFPQPEGITFANNGDMYISNEGFDGKATILKFPHIASK